MSSLVTELNNLSLSAATNQLRLGNPDANGAVTTVSCTAPAAAVTVTVPDPSSSCDIMLGRKTVTAAGATRNIAIGESGRVISCSAAVARVFTLPAVATSAGADYLFVVSVGGANTITISGATAVLNGKVTYGAGAPTAETGLQLTNNTSLVFAASQVIGSWARCVSDGTIWIVSGASTIASGFTAS